MKRNDLKSMSTDQLWMLREKIAATLAANLTLEKALLENRLKQLKRGTEVEDAEPSAGRRPYPIVVPKYRNPDRPSETWAGRGQQPPWLAAHPTAPTRSEES